MQKATGFPVAFFFKEASVLRLLAFTSVSLKIRYTILVFTVVTAGRGLHPSFVSFLRLQSSVFRPLSTIPGRIAVFVHSFMLLSLATLLIY
jgi:hypothetical protein